MILVDFSQIIYAQIGMDLAMNELPVVDEGMLRHLILNKLRFLNVKFRDEYGDMYLVFDDRHYWRKDVFPHYKAGRKKGREESEVDWDQIFEIVEKIKAEVIEFLPFNCLLVEKAEADDIIGATCQKYGGSEKILIISTDGDFKQLQIFPGVKQFRPTMKDWMKEKNPLDYLFQHIISGDKGDGIPNAMADDDVFVVSGKKVPRMTKGRRQSFRDSIIVTNEKPVEFFVDIDFEFRDNFMRNDKLINLTNILNNEYVGESINEQLEEIIGTRKIISSPLHVYLMSRGCKYLAGMLEDFSVGSKTSIIG